MKSNLTCLLLYLLVLCSCDRDKPQNNSQSQPATQESDIIDNRPKAPVALFHRIRLVDYPISLRVPEKWQLKYGGVTLLQGPTPSGPPPDGMVYIMISRQGPLPKGVADAMKPLATKPATQPALERDDVRTMGNMRVYERRFVQPATADLPEMVKWTISVYETIDANNVRLYQLSFLDLKREHFEKDRQLLENIVASLAPPEEGDLIK